MRVCEFTLIHTFCVGGCGFLSRFARAIFVLGFWCFGEQVFAPIFSLRVLRFWSNIYACWWLRVLNPLCTCRYYFSLLLVLRGASHSARKKAGFVRPQRRRLRNSGFAAGRLFCSDCFRCVFAVLVQYILVLAVTGSYPDVHVRLFSWLLVLWGASHCARKKAGFVRPHWRRLRVWGFAVGRFFSIFFGSLRVLRFWSVIYACWRLRFRNPLCTCD